MNKGKEKVKATHASAKDDKIILNMSFVEAMKKALNTPLPQKDKLVKRR